MACKGLEANANWQQAGAEIGFGPWRRRDRYLFGMTPTLSSAQTWTVSTQGCDEERWEEGILIAGLRSVRSTRDFRLLCSSPLVCWRKLLGNLSSASESFQDQAVSSSAAWMPD